MLKYFKEYLSDYQYADFLQTMFLVVSVLFFVSLVYTILKKPKNYFKDESELPLQDEDPLF